MGKNVAIIPARGGSKGIPDKNIRDFYGKPLIAWAIIRALNSKMVDRVIVSTDSEKIASIACFYGAEVPFIRPANISDDNAAIEPVLIHAYDWLKDNEGYKANALVLLMPTNPLRTSRHIDKCIDIFSHLSVDSVITVNESPSHYTPYWTLIKDKHGKVCYFNGNDIRSGYTRRQDFPETCFAKNDLVFVIKPLNLYGNKVSIFGENVELYVTDRIYDGDINNMEDWQLTLQTFKYLESCSKV
ncbi:MAG: acylneuraminate cytidylyltransferase family protein [Lentimicrobiaceae bacterium]|jgi:CMP-N,N'-diacetyllegionaminic acid synthase|nr:acylneuraminate cytidylyltransferase family protein [Lentimicrobiaceae bacterium]